MLAKAEGKTALTAADNTLSSEVIRMRIDMARLDALPVIVDKMMKPAEKIDSIRINHITGFGGDGGATGSGSGDKAVANQVVDSVLSMALQLPAVKKLGQEIGVNIADGIKGVSDAASDTGTNDPTPPETNEDGDTTDKN